MLDDHQACTHEDTTMRSHLLRKAEECLAKAEEDISAANNAIYHANRAKTYWQDVMDHLNSEHAAYVGFWEKKKEEAA